MAKGRCRMHGGTNPGRTQGQGKRGLQARAIYL
ncbi:hypothetical protein WOC76_23225 [Methylocystis sp. IM3]